MKNSNKNKDEDKRKKRIIIILLLLFLLFMLVFLIVRYTMSNKIEKPGGGDIIIDNNPKPDNDDNSNIDNNNQNNENNNIDIGIPNNEGSYVENNNSVINEVNKETEETKNEEQNEGKQDEEEEIDKDIFSVRDSVYKWDETIISPLKIFDKSEENLAVEGKIAPGHSNTYIFTVRNNKEFSVNTSFSFIETNNDNIDMRFRLRVGDSYIAGDSETWVRSSELSYSNKVMPSMSKTVYSLDWKWFEGSNDTEIGVNASIVYSLNISILAEEIE